MDVSTIERTDLPTRDSWKILGGLRFALAMIVCLGHLARFVPDAGLINRGLLMFGGLGATSAVFCFLVISGYSIAHSITVSPEGYFKRRMLRIYPLYLLGIGLALLPFAFVPSPIQAFGRAYELPDLGTLAGNLLLLQGIIAHPLSSNAPLWTLGVEVTCYVLAPLFVRAPRRVLLGIIVVSSLAYAAFPKFHLQFYSQLRFGLPLLFMIWAWLTGFVLYFNRKDARYQLGVPCLGTLLLSTNRAFMTRYSIFTYVASSALILFADAIRPPRPILKVLNYCGELSYPVYIFHAPVLLLCFAVLGIHNGLAMVAAVLLVAAFFYHLVDQPIRRRRSSAARGEPDAQAGSVPPATA
ncbi:MAG: acyltransferase [Sphingomicrobium sp.]